jgi:hypothetical protein
MRRLHLVFTWLRDAWLIVGITLLLCIGLELAYRAQGALKRMSAAEQEVANEEKSEWMPGYLKEHYPAVEAQRWEPYVYHRTSEFAGTYLTVDAEGSRKTVQSQSPGAAEILMLGGSTMFGSFQRDEGTLPSVLARRFEQCDGDRVYFRNRGQSGQVFTQEVIDLMLQLRDGARPRVVVFYDGINDILADIQNNRPGWPQNEMNRSSYFELGRAAFFFRTDVRTELRAAGYLTLAGLTRSKLLQKIRPFGVPGPLPAVDPAVSAGTAPLLKSYGSTVRLVEGLRREFGFVPIYAWQPTIHSTKKPLSPFEARTVRNLEEGESGRRLITMHREAADQIDAVVGPIAGARFLNLSRVFDGESKPVFLDEIGHTYESANEALATALTPALTHALGESGLSIRCQ